MMAVAHQDRSDAMSLPPIPVPTIKRSFTATQRLGVVLQALEMRVLLCDGLIENALEPAGQFGARSNTTYGAYWKVLTAL
jgi:hypothetical protein